MTRASIVLVIVVVAAACVPRSPGRPPAWVGRRLVLGEPGGPQVVLESDVWRRDGARFCVSRGVVDVITPAGPIRLHDADLCATPWPATITGEAQVPLPGIGFLASLVTSTVAPRGRLGLALGRDVGTLAIGAERLPAEPDRYYLSIDLEGPHDIALGRGALTAGSRMIIDPHAPILYVAGDLAGLLPSSVLRGVVLGLAPSGGLLYTSQHALDDGQGSSVRRLTGHLLVQGTVPLGGYPVTVTGRLIVDLDADRDGAMVFVDDPGDFALGGDVTARVGYTAAGFNVGLDVARASVLLERGTLLVGGSVPGSVLAGTTLGAFAPRGDLTVLGTYRSPSDFVLVLRGEGQLAGLPFSNAELALGSRGVALSGRAALPSFGPVDVSGSLGADGAFLVSGRADLRVLGTTVKGALVEVGNRGVQLSGRVVIPALGAVDVAGAVNADGTYALRGRGDLVAAGLPLTGAEVVLASTGLQVSGTVRFAATSFHVAGLVQPDGQVALSGTVPLNVSPIFGRAQLSIGAGGPTAVFQGRVCVSGACVELPETQVDAQGRVCPSFPLIGRQCVKVL